MVIRLEHVRKSYGGKPVITDATLELRGRLCLFGPSGCGKTTLLRLISGLEKPDAGRVLVPKGTRFACHFQEDRLLPWYTAAENLAMTTANAADWLTRVQLAEAGDKYPDELSGGMRRRVSLARALACESDVLLLDEPLRELDAATEEAMLALIDASAGDRLLVLVTHDRAQAERLGCRIIEMPL